VVATSGVVGTSGVVSTSKVSTTTTSEEELDSTDDSNNSHTVGYCFKAVKKLFAVIERFSVRCLFLRLPDRFVTESQDSLLFQV
jgi:hypothetical protein